MTKTPFGDSEFRATKPLELVHSDLMGPIRATSRQGHSYMLLLVDDFSRSSWTFFLESKDQGFETVVPWLAQVERASECKMKTLRSDRGGEYMSGAFNEWLQEQGITHELTCPGTPEQNGVAERTNRTLADAARTIMFQADLPAKYWEDAVAYVSWLRNRLPTAALDGKTTPHTLWKGRKPNLAMAKVFGCMAQVWIPADKRGKFEPHAQWGVFLGIPNHTKGWRFYLPSSGKEVVSRNAFFHEATFYWQLKSRSSNVVSGQGQPLEP